MLVVDDDPEITSTMQRLLEKKFNAATDNASDVSEARQKIFSSSFDVVILDYQLPDGTGLDLLKEIAKRKNRPMVIMVTGQGDEMIAAEAFRLRASGYVVKDGRLPTMLPEVVSGALNEIALSKAEERLRHMEETERALLNATPETLLLIDADGTILVANETGAHRIGMEADEAIGTNVYDYLPAEVRVNRKRRIDSVFRTGEAERFEDSRQGRHFYNVVYPVFNDKGGIERVAIFARDVTEQKKAEKELRCARDELEERVQRRTEQLLEANKELRAEINVRKRVEESLKTLSAQVQGQARMLDQILSSSPDFFYLLDKKGKFIYANSTAADILGLRQVDMEGKYWWDLGLPQEGMKRLDVHREAVLSSGEQRVGRINLPTPGGEREFEYILSPIRGFDGRTSTVVATLREVYGEVLLVDELEQQVARLSEHVEVLDMVPLCLILRDMYNRITFWNAGAEGLFGWSREEALGHVAHELLETEFLKPLGDISFELIEHGYWHGRLVKTTRDRKQVELDSSWFLRHDSDGQPRAVLEVDEPVAQQAE